MIWEFALSVCALPSFHISINHLCSLHFVFVWIWALGRQKEKQQMNFQILDKIWIKIFLKSEIKVLFSQSTYVLNNGTYESEWMNFLNRETCIWNKVLSLLKRVKVSDILCTESTEIFMVLFILFVKRRLRKIRCSLRFNISNSIEFFSQTDTDGLPIHLPFTTLFCSYLKPLIYYWFFPKLSP